LERIRSTLLERFGTAQVAEAFRALYRRYGEGVMELLLLEDRGELKLRGRPARGVRVY